MKHLYTFFVAIFLCTGLTLAQSTIKVSGTVFDENREPLIGVSIQIKGTTNGTISDIDGNFSIEAKSADILVFNYIGFTSAEYPVKNRMDVVMIEDQMNLSEVVVIGYGVQRKAITMGSMQTIASGSLSDKDKKGKTWKRSGLSDNSIRLQVGDDDYIPLESAHVAILIEGFRVRILMDCFFFNDKQDGLEGVFKLKLPTGASPYYFAFGETEYKELEDDDSNVIGKTIPYTKYSYDNFNLTYKGIEDSDRDWEGVREARIVSKQKAAKAYEDIVSANIDPALMEWGGADMFSCRVFPLSKNKLHQVVIGYDLDMTEALNFREFIMSLPKTEKDLKIDICVHNSTISPIQIFPNLTPALRDEDEEITEENKDKVVYTLFNPKMKEITFSYNHIEPMLLVQSDKIDNDDSNAYFASNYRIELPEEPEQNLPADAVFLLDASLSSSPDKFNVWIKLMQEILTQNRDIIKRFAIMSFNVENKWYKEYYMKNNYFNIDAAMEYINTLALEGATDLGVALKEGSNPSWLKKNAPKHIFLLSDADCNWGDVNKHSFKYLLNHGDRIHTYKTGLSGTNMGVLDYLSRISGGYSFTVTGEEEAELTAKSFRYKPWLVEKIEVEGVEDFLISGNPTQLYNGQKLLFTGRGIPSGNIRIKVNNGTEQKTLICSAKEKINTVTASRIYGQIALSYLDNYGFKTEDAAVNYSSYYRVPGQYTSFLMLENDYEYEDYGAIDDYDSRNFVEDNSIASIIDAMEKSEATSTLGKSKDDFRAWLERLKGGDSVIDFSPDEEFMKYIEGLPEEIFSIWKKPISSNIFFTDQQSDIEKEILANEDIRLDRVIKLAKSRKSRFKKDGGLKLLSSVIERNSSDIQTIRDVAMIATDWGMGDQAYFMMKRIIDWRQGEAIAYLTAADALASTINNHDMALIYYYICLNSNWDSDYGSFEDIAALRALRYINRITNDPNTKITNYTRDYLKILKTRIEEKLKNNDLLFTEADIVVIVNWNIDNTDIDLHVLEPSGEECYYSNRNTESGGKLTIDVTDGYGPEMYVLEKAPAGEYKIMLKYFADSRIKTASKAKAYIDVYRNWGRKDETVVHKTILLETVKDKLPVLIFKVKDESVKKK